MDDATFAPLFDRIRSGADFGALMWTTDRRLVLVTGAWNLGTLDPDVDGRPVTAIQARRVLRETPFDVVL